MQTSRKEKKNNKKCEDPQAFKQGSEMECLWVSDVTHRAMMRQLCHSPQTRFEVCGGAVLTVTLEA